MIRNRLIIIIIRVHFFNQVEGGKSWDGRENREKGGNFVSLTAKPWELAGLDTTTNSLTAHSFPSLNVCDSRLTSQFIRFAELSFLRRVNRVRFAQALLPFIQNTKSLPRLCSGCSCLWQARDTRLADLYYSSHLLNFRLCRIQACTTSVF